MSLLKKKTAEELKAEAERQASLQRQAEARKRAAEEQKERERIAQERRDFEMSPAGRARAAFARKDHVFQYSMDVMNQQAVIIMMVGGTTTQSTTDPVDVLNSVCREGWDLVNGSFVFVEQGKESRDKFMSSGQNVAIKGRTVGYYLFKRFPANRRP
ncbi:hypothetical protein [Amycolatopsis sp. CA-230715]|uniref:hypothetical protein n=1 Tax=Amycolatopsis sp. CA-230715 TaxID=2745196 RepID=UPI001C0216B3|nr:hypothetical protein [Amycolatopsis sp. CA-230715]QWF81493.1 hypothetical protein HUW46_04925 [Amycolatopsis sp. CA-230715]